VRVGILSQWYDPEPGSAAVPGVLARGLRDRGHEVRVVTGFPNYPTGTLSPGYRVKPRVEENVDGIPVRRVALYPSHDRSPARRAANYLSFALSAAAFGTGALRDIDALWVYNSPATVGIPSWLASCRGGPPHLMHVMDLWPDSVAFSGLTSERHYRRFNAHLARWCDWTYRNAAGIAGISRGICNELVERGVPASKVHYIPVWVDDDKYEPRGRDEHLARDLSVADTFVLLYAGNLGETQGLETVLDACQRVGDLEAFCCLVAGSGTAEVRLRARAEDLSLHNVRFLGRWPASDITRLMSVGDVHLVTLSGRRLSEITYPSKLPATLASAKPIIACARGEVRRIVLAAGAGWAVPPGDAAGLETAIREAYALDREGVAKLGAAGRRYYEAELSHGIEAVESLLIELTGTRSRGRSE
jgi:putative colanic acid biosynthesis glycosyltransferase WcaI